MDREVSMRPTIVVINDDQAFLRIMVHLLAIGGYEMIPWLQGATAHEVINQTRPALVILDVRLQYPDEGLKVLELLRLDPATRAIPVILCSADPSFLAAKAQQLRTRGVAVLEKPFDLQELLDAIAREIGPGVIDEVDG